MTWRTSSIGVCLLLGRGLGGCDDDGDGAGATAEHVGQSAALPAVQQHQEDQAEGRDEPEGGNDPAWAMVRLKMIT